jgi:protein O-mannosyl-transferase
MMIPSLNRLSLDIKKPYQICLLFIAVLTIYYPSLSAEISVLDDREALFSLFNLQSFDFKTIFFPKVQGGGYYRPFISLSYMIDRFWWDLSLQTMHLENMLLHLANVLMVFWLGVKLCTSSTNGRGLLPFSGALLFALHPINTESINWISGRTDPMACFFVLSAFLLLIIYHKNKNILLLVAAFFVAMLGVLAKETALAFIPAAFFVLLASDDNLERSTNASYWNSTRKTRIIFAIYSFIAILLALYSMNYYLVLATGAVFALQLYLLESNDVTKQKLFGSLKLILCVVSLFILLLLLFYGLRKVVFESDMPKIPNVINVMTADINYTIELFLGAAGFYVKKFFSLYHLTSQFERLIHCMSSSEYSALWLVSIWSWCEEFLQL